ncbi:MAG: dienelactone hydrolase family protein [Deltaproteobacteria bacterium]|nr:dienelactone hydrolase family protein [Deltaproteobacteria bacterium]
MCLLFLGTQAGCGQGNGTSGPGELPAAGTDSHDAADAPRATDDFGREVPWTDAGDTSGTAQDTTGETGQDTALADSFAEIREDSATDPPGETSQDTSPDGAAPAQADPALWGPHEVGMTSFQWFDLDRLRLVPTTVWYPAIPMGQPRASYLVILQGKAYANAPRDPTGAPYPVVLFSHGFRGTAVQSVTFTEYLASHGYVVVAMDHSGNTLTDFFSDDETVAQVALERPNDVAFAYGKIMEFAAPGSELLSGMVDPTRVGVCGHSFGGYTALVVAGGLVDVSGAQAACAAGSPSDIFCDYVGYWPAGTTVGLSPQIPGLLAAAYFAPGGYSAFGDAGLAEVDVPSLIFGGTLDDTCPVDVEIDPIYVALPVPKGRVVISDASHMSFTNICDIPLAQQFLADYCDVAGIIGEEEGFAIMNTLTVAFFDRYLKGQAEFFGDLSQGFSDATWGGAAQVTTEW